jgi:hypothetical protein
MPGAERFLFSFFSFALKFPFLFPSAIQSLKKGAFNLKMTKLF